MIFLSLGYGLFAEPTSSASSSSTVSEEIASGAEGTALSNQTESQNSEIPDENTLPMDADSSVDEEDFTLDDTSSPARSIWIFVRMILVLAFIIAIILFLSKFIKKKSNLPATEDEFLRDVASIAVGPNKSVHVVTLINEAYLIGVSDNCVNLIAKVEDKELINAMNVYADEHIGQKKSLNFAEILNLFTKKSDSEKKENPKNKGDGATRQILNMLKNNGKRLNKDQGEK